jgi:hypothetical protein
MTPEERAAEVTEIIASAATLPLRDAAYSLWRSRYRLDTLEDRPTADEVRINRALSPAALSAKIRYEHDHAQDGPAFVHMKRAFPDASDDTIKQAVIAAVEFEDACEKYFLQDNKVDYWERCVRAVACARKENPGYLESTYQAACNNVAYDWK